MKFIPRDEIDKIEKDNPRELDRKEPGGMEAGKKRPLSTGVGEGGASWRLKALKRAQELVACEGRKLQEAVEERLGSMGHFGASVSPHNVAPTHAHLQAIKNRRKELIKEEKKNTDGENDRIEKDNVALVSTAISSLNKFSSYGSFMDKVINQKKDNFGETKSVEFAPEKTNNDAGTANSAISANQLAAKALQVQCCVYSMCLPLESSYEMMEVEVENIKEMQDVGNESSGMQIDGTTSRFIMHDISARQKKEMDDTDLHLAQKIMHNHQYSTSNQADEYDYDDEPRRKTRKRGRGGNHKSSEITNFANRFLTQQERCQFCFENPTRQKHLVIAIANFTYLSLPQQQPVVPGHCGILTLQHESSTRSVDDNVWDEIRNFKKCLIKMFAEQEMDVAFLETVMGLARQKRHCLVERVPLPREVANQAPVYFMKAIDEAEDDWSQHDTKKLIDTNGKGLRDSVPQNFPYFHVEFGLNKGFAHVIDNEEVFHCSFGLNVIRGMLGLPADMHRRRRHLSVETQRQALR
ncbi:hypothetical protein BUALT_Bualt14G0044400 [Buddleja alternifolia]|uniref:CWF19-like protein 2 n=1 Tax=Buddleja alternifolia TaxID=168488 RepID=A0AAV6WMS4_9LAMI|nr:hypothetical protein BUALT_Bualt14G0044400 [Buddleja alternifolia]